MPIIQKSVSIGASASVPNQLAGELFEFLPYPAHVELGLTQSATGLLIDFISGKDVVSRDFTPNVRTSAPIYPDDFTLTDVAGPGERLVLSVRNTTAGALTLYYTVKITPI